MKATKRIFAMALAIVMVCSTLALTAFAKAAPVSFTIEQGKVFMGGDVNFDSAHASTIVKLDDGRLMCAWFGGSGEGEKDVRIWYSFYENNSWTVPAVIATSDNVAHWNPVLQNFGSYARVYFKVGKDTASWVTKYADYDLAAGTMSAVRELVPGDTTGGRGPVKNKCLVTSAGVIIAPASTEQGDWKAFFDISTDGGATWTKTAYIDTPKTGLLGKKVEMIQPTLWEDASGVIHAMFRTKSNYVYRSDSTDGGFTWCKAYKTSLPNNNSGIDCVVTDNGWLWVAYNPISAQGLRYKLCVAVSKDNGNTWEAVTTLESSSLIWKEYSYPSMIADGNRIYISYTFERTRIKYAFIDFVG